MSGLITNTMRNADGSLTTIILNNQGIEVARLEGHSLSADEMLPLARRFRDENPELFGEEILIDTAAESKRKNETAFKDGLQSIPGH